MNIKTDKVVKEFVLPFKSSTHGQIRHARLTEESTLLVAHMDLGKVNEYDIDGNQLSSIDVPSVWSAVPLKNGNLLVASNQNFVREITRKGSVVWDFPLADITSYKITSPQIALRLPNGNTLVNNWFNQWSTTFDPNNVPIQAIEVTPDKKLYGPCAHGRHLIWAPQLPFNYLRTPTIHTEKFILAILSER